jgi:hypothetical protein
MTHPLYKSKNGAILYGELPSVMRLYDNVDAMAGRKGDLENFIHGFGHMLDRFEATLEQFYADGFLETVSPSGDPTMIQEWLLPYVADLFGVTLVAPDPDSRRRELASSIWVAKRRGTKAAVDHAAETILDLPVVIVEGSSRVAKTPNLKDPLITHREVTAKWHPKDANILLEPLPASTPLTHEIGFDATRPNAHAGLVRGTPDARRHMRALQGGLNQPDADVRPTKGSDGIDTLSPFYIMDRRGVPCFPDSYEDRSMRAPDMRTPAKNRPAWTELKRPGAVNLFIRPPSGFCKSTDIRLNRAPNFDDGEVQRNGPILQNNAIADVFFDAPSTTRIIRSSNADELGKHHITDLKFSGTLTIRGGTDVILENCAISTLEIASNFTGRAIHLRNCLFDQITSTATATEVSGVKIILEYVTVLGDATFTLVHASDCLFAGSLTVTGDGSEEKTGCLRYCRLPLGFDRAQVHTYLCSNGTANFLTVPCLPNSEDEILSERQPIIGEVGYGVLSDKNSPEVMNGAQDGGELGAYHDSYHLARLTAAKRKAQGYVPAGTQVFGQYDKRLMADLPTYLKEEL